MRRFIIPAIAAALLCGCNVDDEGTPSAGGSRVDLRPGIEALTRAPHLNEDGSGYFNNGDVFSLAVSGDGDYFQMTDYTMPRTALYWEDFRIPAETERIRFAGCYPKHDGDGAVFVFNVNEAATKDLLLAPAVEVRKGDTKAIAMPFYHAMHSLVIRYKSDNYSEDELKTVKTTIRAVAECQVDLKAGKVADAVSPASEEYQELTGKEVSALLVPQAKNGVSLGIEVDGKKLSYGFSALPETTDKGQNVARLEGGKQLVVVLNINKDGITVADMTIQKWDQQGSVSGDIII